MNGHWNWLIGRKVSLGEVVDVFGESATVRHGDDETRVLLCELLHEDYKAQDRAAASMALTAPELRAGVELQRKEIDRLKQQLRDEGDRIAELTRAIEAMRVAGGSVEFQMAFDMAKALTREERQMPGPKRTG